MKKYKLKIETIFIGGGLTYDGTTKTEYVTDTYELAEELMVKHLGHINATMTGNRQSAETLSKIIRRALLYIQNGKTAYETDELEIESQKGTLSVTIDEGNDIIYIEILEVESSEGEGYVMYGYDDNDRDW